MNYRHIYHAGNFADVFKHIILTLVIVSLKQKEKPFCYIDTHAGIGLYDLTQQEVKRSPEYLEGINLLWQRSDYPACFKPYVEMIKKMNPEGLMLYPGSPWIAKELIREKDPLILNELHPDDFKLLKKAFKHVPEAHVHHRDAYEFLGAMLPPKPARGIILIDPPFEKMDEFALVKTHLLKALKRFHHGVYLIWYPIKTQKSSEGMLALQRSLKLPSLNIELLRTQAFEQAQGLSACGMLMVNPPWQIEKILTPAIHYLNQLFKI